MRHNVLETVLGAVVLSVAGGFLAFAYQSRHIGHVEEGYEVTARFQSADGLSAGSDVRLGGIKIGVIDSLTLDPKTYQAVARLQLRQDVPLPTDSTASVSSDGLLGGKYVGLEPGAEDAMIEPGGEIQFTQSSVSIESLIGKFMHGGAEGEGDKPKNHTMSAPAAAALAQPE